MPETLYIVDTMSLIFQVFHAIRGPMTGSRGQPTNAVYGLTGDIRHLLNEIKPSHILFAMDSPAPAKRNEIYAEYKANRSAMPDDLRPQIPMILDVITAYNIPAIECPGWEADDVIATVTKQAVERGLEVRIVTNDKDARQLLGPHVQLYNIRKRQFLDEAFLLKDWGVRPDQVIDFQALVGDSVDNVPGVPLVGPKKAMTLLEQFGTLEEVLANADKAPGKKLQENLKTHAAQAHVSRELVTLKNDLTLDIDWEATRVSPPDYERLAELFTDFAFGRYAEEVRNQRNETGTESTQSRHWDVIDTPDKFATFLAELSQQSRFCVDLETTGLDALRVEIVGLAFCWKANSAHYLPIDGPPGQPTLAIETVIAALKPLLENPDIEVVNQNIKYDMLVLRRYGIEVRGLGVDPMIGDYLLDAGARTHNLDRLAKDYLHRQTIPISDLIGKGKKQKMMFEVDIKQVGEYASEDADIAWQLSDRIAADLRKEGLWDLYWSLERPLISVLAQMEINGIKVDVDELQRQSRDLDGRLHATIAEIYDLAGREFNIDSPKQLSEILFDELKLPVQRKTKTGNSTDADVLERLSPLHPLPAKIIAHRQITKLKNTYLDALPNMVNPETGRIHASFNQVVASTGRLSSSDPNLQNIPIRTEEGSRVRRAFIPSESGWKLLCADYSQVELRMLAHFSRDEEMRAAFERGDDIHAAVAAEVFDVPMEMVNANMRRVAKAVNFGVIYGQTPWGLAAALGIPQDDAARFIDDYFSRFAGVATYLDAVLDETARTGYATTILGRRRAITGIREPRIGSLNLSERTAINSVIQGSAADLIKRAMLDIHESLRNGESSARMLLQIHDELVFEVPEKEVDFLCDLVRGKMENALDLSVPIVVDVKVGDNWLDAEVRKR